MATPSQIADAIGRKELADRLGVGLTAVSNAVVKGFFPASWFPIVSSACREKSVDCPMSAFNWRSPEQSPMQGVS